MIEFDSHFVNAPSKSCECSVLGQPNVTYLNAIRVQLLQATQPTLRNPRRPVSFLSRLDRNGCVSVGSREQRFPDETVGITRQVYVQLIPTCTSRHVPAYM